MIFNLLLFIIIIIIFSKLYLDNIYDMKLCLMYKNYIFIK